MLRRLQPSTPLGPTPLFGVMSLRRPREEELLRHRRPRGAQSPRRGRAVAGRAVAGARGRLALDSPGRGEGDGEWDSLVRSLSVYLCSSLLDPQAGFKPTTRSSWKRTSPDEFTASESICSRTTLCNSTIDQCWPVLVIVQVSL